MGQIHKVRSALKKRSTIMGAVASAAVMAAAVLVVQSNPRAELDVDLSDGAVWLASNSIGGVSLLDGGSGTIAASLGVAQPGDDFSVEQFGSDAVIVNRTDGTVARLDGSSWEIATGRVQLGEPGAGLDVVTGKAGGWLVTPGQATTVDLEDLALRTPVPVAAPFADGIVADNGDLIFASTDPQIPVQRLAANGGASSVVEGLDGPTALIDLGLTAAGVDLDERSVWVEGLGTVCETLEFPEGATLHAGGGDGVLLVVSDQGGAFAWDPTTGCPGANEFLNLGPGTYGDPVVTDGWAVVPEIATASVLVIDLDSRSVTERQDLDGVVEGTEVALIAEDGAVWYNDTTSSHAGLIRRDGSVVPISKYEEGASGFTAAPVEGASDDAEDVSVAGAAQEQLLDEDPAEAEQVAGPELTTTTVAGGQDDGGSEDDEPAASTTSTTVDPGTDGGGPDEGTTTTTEGGTGGPGEGGEEGTTTTTEGGGEEETTTTTEPELAITIGVSAFSVVEGNDINFTSITQHGNPNSWAIDFSPAGPQILPIESFGSFRVLFPEAGQYVVTMTACEADDRCTDARVIVDIVEDPDAVPLVAAIDGPSTVVVGETASFSDISQGDPDSWSWSTDGGSPASATTQNVDVSWPTPGPRTVTLRVERGSSSRITTFDIDVVNAPTPAPFGLICVPSPAQFAIATGTDVECQLDGSVDDFSGISFSTTADGAAGFSSSVPAPGRFVFTSTQERTVTVTLTAIDDGTGDTRSDNATVSFTAPICAAVLPNVNVSGPSTLEVGTAGSFSGTPTNGCGTVSRAWSATGGATISNPSGSDTTISWASAGTYTVTFDFSDGGGPGSDSLTVTVTEPVTEPDAPSISIGGPGSLDTDESGTYTVTNNGGPITSYSWTTNGGGGSGSGSSFTGSWANAGSYTVTLTATGPGGTDTATRNVSVTDPPIPPSPFGMTCDRNSAEVDQIFNCDLTTGDSADFSNPQWSVSPASAQSWLMNPWSYDAAGTVAGSTVTVTLTATDLATGQTVSASDSVSITAPVVQPQTLTIGCDQGTAEMFEIVSCFLTSGNESAFSNPSWSVSGDHDRWGGGAYALDVAGNSEGTITVTLSATDIGTGQVVSDSRSITITPIAPPPPPQMTVSCSMLNDIRARCTANNTNGYSSPSWAVSGNGFLRWGGNNAFTIEVGTTVAGSTITVTITATHSSGQVSSASGSITIANAT